MWEVMEEAQKALFDYDIPRASQALVEIFEVLVQLEEKLDVNRQEQFRSALVQMNLALERQDYLQIADLLKFAIWPLISQEYQ